MIKNTIFCQSQGAERCNAAWSVKWQAEVEVSGSQQEIGYEVHQASLAMAIDGYFTAVKGPNRKAIHSPEVSIKINNVWTLPPWSLYAICIVNIRDIHLNVLYTSGNKN